MQIQIWSQSRATWKGIPTVSLTGQSSDCSGETFNSMVSCSLRCMLESDGGKWLGRHEGGLGPLLCKSFSWQKRSGFVSGRCAAPGVHCGDRSKQVHPPHSLQGTAPLPAGQFEPAGPFSWHRATTTGLSHGIFQPSSPPCYPHNCWCR